MAVPARSRVSLVSPSYPSLVAALTAIAIASNCFDRNGLRMCALHVAKRRIGC
jgi:hypothetical protein